MNDEKHLRELLSAAVPEAPANPGRASDARAYAATRRRRTAMAAAALGVATVIGAIAVPVALSRDDGGRGGGPAPQASSSSPAVEDDFSCPPTPRSLADAAPVTGPDQLPSGAVAVRICDPGGLSGAPPVDALTTRVADVADSVNALPRKEPCSMIPMDLGATWDLVFLYPDGHTQTVRGATYGCGGVEIGSIIRGDRGNADRPLRLLQKLLWEQRASAPPPNASVAAPRCRGGDVESAFATTTMPLQNPLTLKSAVLCWRFETESEQPTQQATISDVDLATLLDDLNHNRTSREITEQECVDPDVVHYEIRGVNAWGDGLSLDGYCGAFDLSDSNSDIWRPNPESQAILDRLVAANPAVILDPDDRTPPDQVLSIWADLVNSGKRDRADALWAEAPKIPAGVRVDLKADGQRTITPEPGTPLSAYTQVMEVTALYRLVPPDGSWVDYHEMRFTLGREGHGSVWQIVSMTDLGPVTTGR